MEAATVAAAVSAFTSAVLAVLTFRYVRLTAALVAEQRRSNELAHSAYRDSHEAQERALDAERRESRLREAALAAQLAPDVELAAEADSPSTWFFATRASILGSTRLAMKLERREYENVRLKIRNIGRTPVAVSPRGSEVWTSYGAKVVPAGGSESITFFIASRCVDRALAEPFAGLESIVLDVLTMPAAVRDEYDVHITVAAAKPAPDVESKQEVPAHPYLVAHAPRLRARSIVLDR